MAFISLVILPITATGLELEIQDGVAIFPDGIIESSEWDDVPAIELGASNLLRMKYSDEWLYLAIESPQAMVVNVLIQTQSQIRVMHSSAALGTAVYMADERGYALEKAFQWHCRDPGNSSSAVEARARFLENEGWLASIVRQGVSTQVEYQISVSEGTFQILLGLLPVANPSDFLLWPAGVDQNLFPGPIPTLGLMDPTQWVSLTLVNTIDEGRQGGID